MKIIHKYVLREHAGPLVFALSALTSLMLLNYVAKQLGNLVGKGLSWTVILEFFVLSIPFTVAMTLPMAVLVAVLYAFSRLAAENEITALKANGVSMGRLLVPVIVGGALLSLTMVIFNDQVLPRTNHRLRTLQGDIARKKPTFAIKEQIINEVAPNSYFLRTNHLNRETNGMREVTIYDLSDPMRRRTIYADSGTMAFTEDGTDLQLTLYSGFMQEVPRETPTQLQRLYFTTDLIRVPGVANAFERDSSDTYKSDREMSVCELQGEVARYERDYFRSFEDFRRASQVVRTNPSASVTLTPSYSSTAPRGRAERSRVRSLGRAYCDFLDYANKVRVERLSPAAKQGAKKAASLIAPREAQAADAPRGIRQQQQPQPQQPQPLQQQQAQQKGDTTRKDTLAARRDTLGARRDTLGAKRDTLPERRDTVAARPDSTQRTDSVAPGGIRVDSAAVPGTPGATPPGAVLPDTVPPGTVPPGYVPGQVLPPSAGGVPQPATIVMETARSQMLTARTQMNQFAVEIQKKFAISMACVIFVLLGAPIALRFPRGGVGLVIGVSLGVFGLYYVGLIAGEALADRAILTPFWAMWSANILFTLLAIILLSRMGRETATSRGGDISEIVDAFKGLFRRRRDGAA